MNLLINFLFFSLSWSQTAAGGVSLPQGEGELWKGGKDPRSQTNTSIILQTPVSSPAFPCHAPGWPKVGEMGSSGWATCEQEPGLGRPLAWLRVWISGTRGFQQLQNSLAQNRAPEWFGCKDLKAHPVPGPWLCILLPLGSTRSRDRDLSPEPHQGHTDRAAAPLPRGKTPRWAAPFCWTPVQAELPPLTHNWTSNTLMPVALHFWAQSSPNELFLCSHMFGLYRCLFLAGAEGEQRESNCSLALGTGRMDLGVSAPPTHTGLQHVQTIFL